MMDLVINHTAKDSVLVDQHPEWYLRHHDGNLVSPGCQEDGGNWVTWEDLAELDYGNHNNRGSLIPYWCDLVRHYVRLGVKGFRCDAAYQVPAEIWQPVIQAAREQRGDVLFAAETLGCTPDEVAALAPSGFDLLFNSSKWWDFKESWLLDQYEQFRHIAPSVSFPESHDTERLITELNHRNIHDMGDVERIYKQRYMFAALFSTGVMLPVGYEYGFRKKLHVVESRPHDWEHHNFDLTDFIADVHKAKQASPALNEEGPQWRLDFHHHPRLTGLARRSRDEQHWALVMINREISIRHEIQLEHTGLNLASGIELTPGRERARLHPERRVSLEPSEIRVFAGPH